MTDLPTGDAQPDLTVCILSWNTRELLRRCLQSIYSPTAAAVGQAWNGAGRPLTGDEGETITYEVIVVDQESLDQSADMVEAEFPQVRLIRQKPNLGFAGGNNLAFHHARGRHFLLLNSDTVVRPGMFTSLVEYADNHLQVGLLGPKVLNPDGSLQASCRRFPTMGAGLLRNTPLSLFFRRSRAVRDYLMEDFKHDQPRDVDWLSGCCVLARRTLYEQIGGLDDEYFMYFEDVDWSMRAHQGGWQVVYYPGPTVIHEVGRSTDKAVKRMIVRHHRSAYRFFVKHYPAWQRPHRRVILATGLAMRLVMVLMRNQLLRIKLRWSQWRNRSRESKPDGS